jgi:hypothetical protein
MGLLFISQMIFQYGQPWWNYNERGKLKDLEKNHFIHYKFHMD